MREHKLASDMVVTITVGYALATVAALFAIQLRTRDSQTIGVGFLVPLFVLPAIVGYVLLTAMSRFYRWRSIIYAVLAMPMPILFLQGALFASPGAREYGADEWCIDFLLTTIAAGVAGYAALRWWLPRGKGD